MADRQIARFVANIQHNCAWAQMVRFKNEDGTDFDLSPGTLTGQIRTAAARDTAPLATITITDPGAGTSERVLSLSAHDTGLLPARAGVPFTVTTKIFAEIDFVPTADPQNPIRLAEGDVRVSPGGNQSATAAAAPTVQLETVNLVVGAASPATTRALLGLSPAQVAYQTLMMG